jgi:dienelactone hydrolase
MHRHCLRHLAALALPLALAGCAKEIETYAPPAGSVQAIFDPSTTPPAVPTPTDLAKGQTPPYLLKVPVADATTKPAQAYFDTFLNTLNGFPTSATAEVRFDGELEESSITKDSVLVYELPDPTKPVAVADLVYEYKTVEATATTAKGSMIRIWNYAGWKRGTKYVFLVRGGDKGVKGKTGPVIRSALFELAAADKALCAWDNSRSWDPSTKTCATPGDGKTATGCCTFNYSALIESSVKKTLRAKMVDKPIDEVDKAIHAEVLAKATDFERLRTMYNTFLLPVAGAANAPLQEIVVAWNFTTTSMNEGVFDPAALVPRVPTPTDLVPRDPATGLLVVPSSPTASPAEKAFNAYLSSLDGFPASSTAALEFTAELESASVGASLVVYEHDGKGTLAAATDAAATWDAARKRVVVTRKGGFKRATTHVVVALGGDKGLQNKDTALAKAPKRSALMQLALSPHALCTYDTAAKKCSDALVSSFIDDPATKAGKLTAVEKATKFEQIRQGYDPLLKLAETKGHKRDDVIALWTFTTLSMTEAIFDTSAGIIPFPSDFLLDSAGLAKNPPEYRVAIPAPANETPTEKALREGLNTLDGFTLQGKYLLAVSGPVDPASLKPLYTYSLIDTEAKAPVLDAEVKFEPAAGAITIRPTKPLAERTRYAIAFVSKLKPGDPKPDGEGLKDDKGRRVVPSPTTVLLRSADPLVDASGKSLVSAVDDATAAAAEKGRLALKSLFDGLAANPILPTPRENIVAAWTFRTQSYSDTPPKLRALPWQALAAADGQQPKWVGKLDPSLASWPTAPAGKKYPKDNLSALGKGVFVSVNLIDEQGTGAFLPDPTKAKPTTAPFYLTLPKGAMPAAGWPLVVVQHGIYGSKNVLFEIADALGKAGFAALAFDLIYHGERSWCTKDAHCESGTCDLKTGQCPSGVKLKDSNSDGTPDASGERHVQLLNPFAVRDNIRQYIIDGAALLRSIKLGSGPSGLDTWGSNKIDAAQVYYNGISFGSMHGALLLAADPLPRAANLNVVGAPLAHTFVSSPKYSPGLDPLLPTLGITKGSYGYVRLFESIFQWIVDPADAGVFAKHLKTVQLPDLVAKADGSAPVPKKDVIVQLAGNDQSVPKQFGDYFALAAGIDTSKTVYAGQGHGFLTEASPDQLATNAAQAQMVEFFKDPSKVCTPNFTDGTCK